MTPFHHFLQPRLLADHREDEPIARPDQLQHGDLSQLLHGQGVDDERDDNGGHQQQNAGEHADLPACTIHQRLCQNAFLLGLDHGGKMPPSPSPRRNGVRVGVRGDSRDHRIDGVLARARDSPRRLHTGCGRRKIKLKLLGIKQ
ncbi:MAG: hypothetical protein HC774_05410 [Sphingomonadales bacterium]|nr:hypothetical protein [Sphingomonadales bacterium]